MMQTDLSGSLNSLFKLTISILSFSIVTSCSAGEALVTLDPMTKYQVISGWEVTAEIAGEPKDRDKMPLYQDIVYDMAVYDVGINRVRLEVHSGIENDNNLWTEHFYGRIGYDEWKRTLYATVNDNDDPHVLNPQGFNFDELDFQIENAVLPLRKRLEKLGESLFVNLCYVAFTDQIKNGAYHHDDAEEYAEFVLATYLYMNEKYGFVPDTWEVILEPDLVEQWDGTTIGRAIVASAKRLESHGFTPKFVAPSVTDMSNAALFFDDIVKVEGAAQYLVEFSYHRYKGRNQGNLKAIVKRAKKYNIDTSMLEWWFGHGTDDVLHQDLKVGMNSAWQGRVLKGLFDIKFNGTNPPVVTMRDEIRFNQQYFRYVRAGAQRIGTKSSTHNFDPLAFINKDGSYVVVVNAASGGNMTVSGLPEGNYHVSYTTEHRSENSQEDILVKSDGILHTSIPSEGVLTVFAENTVSVP